MNDEFYINKILELLDNYTSVMDDIVVSLRETRSSNLEQAVIANEAVYKLANVCRELLAASKRDRSSFTFQVVHILINLIRGMTLRQPIKEVQDSIERVLERTKNLQESDLIKLKESDFNGSIH